MYLKSFSLPTDSDELGFLFGMNKLDRTCNSQANAYPFHIFPNKGLETIEFAPITILSGKNGSGKSTLLNLIAEKLRVRRTAPYNNSILFDDYLNMCSYMLDDSCRSLPRASEIITSDGVFDLLLDVRAINEGIDRRREDLLTEYSDMRRGLTESGWQMTSLDEYDELKRRNEIRRSSASEYASRRLKVTEANLHSNGESAYSYFTRKIGENALYLLDEPENSLSPMLVRELATFLSDSARFYGCQLIISTHSLFLLSMKNAVVYDLDAYPARRRKWTELEHVRAYYDLFRDRMNEFE